MADNDLVTVFEGDFDEGEVVREVLESNGIDAFLDGKPLSMASLPILGGRCRIQVLETDVANARDVITSSQTEPVTEYINAPLKKYLRDCSGEKAAPGGGSVSALVGTLGASMVTMACTFTAGKKKFADVEEEVHGISNEVRNIGEELLRLVQEDVEVYNTVTDAYGLPKETPEQKQERADAIQEAMKKAMEVPMEAVKFSARALGHLPRLAEIANPNLASDVGVGALMLEAGMQGAALNVKINLKYIKDEALVARTQKELDSIMSEAVLNKKKAFDSVQRLIEK